MHRLTRPIYSIVRRLARPDSRFPVPIVIGCALLLASCANYTADRGVDNAWRAADIPAFEIGGSTQSDVIERLGPPSQVIGLSDQVIFYYLRERSEAFGVILIVFNMLTERITYDRAIFFFDTGGVLRDYAYSLEALPNDS